jgi:hypothetical protein
MERLRTELRVQAWLRRAQGLGLMATVARKGDADAGALFVKINRFKDGCDVLSGTFAPDGTPAWMRPLGTGGLGTVNVPEREADQYLTRQATYDPDLWVLEIEDPRGQFVFDEPVLKV